MKAKKNTYVYVVSNETTKKVLSFFKNSESAIKEAKDWEKHKPKDEFCVTEVLLLP